MKEDIPHLNDQIVLTGANPWRLSNDEELCQKLQEFGYISHGESQPLSATKRLGYGQENTQITQFECTLTEFGRSNLDDDILREAKRRGFRFRAAKN